MSLNNLGLLYQKSWNLVKAEEFYLKSLKIKQYLFGENHADVATSLNNLRLLYKKLGNLVSFGENHADVATSLNNLRLLYKKLGNLEVAEEFI